MPGKDEAYIVKSSASRSEQDAGADVGVALGLGRAGGVGDSPSWARRRARRDPVRRSSSARRRRVGGRLRRDGSPPTVGARARHHGRGRPGARRRNALPARARTAGQDRVHVRPSEAPDRPRRGPDDRGAERPRSGRAVIDVCIAAHENEEFRNLFTFLEAGGRHLLGHRGSELVSHAVVTTRWAQPAGQPALRTAYVDAVATLPAYQSQRARQRGHAPAGGRDRRLRDRLPPDGPARPSTSAWAGRCGEDRWPGAARRASCPHPTSAASWCCACRRRRRSTSTRC